MASTTFASNDPRTQKKWAQGTGRFGLKNMVLLPLFGSTEESIFYVKKDLQGKAGDTIVFEADEDTTGTLQGDDGNNEGNELAFGMRNMSVVIHECSAATRPAGQMSLQRTRTFRADGFRRFAKRKLGILYKQALEDMAVASAAGLYNENAGGSAIECINESYPTANRIYYGGQSIGASPALGTAYSTDAALTAGTQASNLFGTLVINKIRANALAASPRFRPGSFYQTTQDAGGSREPRNTMAQKHIADLYALLAHPYQVQSMRSEIGNIGWNQMVALAAQRSDQHPVFRHGSVLWYGTLIQEYDRIPLRTGAGGTTLAEGFLLNAGRTATTDACASGRSVARALFLGAQAVSVAWGKPLNWYEGWIDDRIPRVVIDWIWGIKRSLFNPHGDSTPGSAEDEAVYCIDTEVIV